MQTQAPDTPGKGQVRSPHARRGAGQEGAGLDGPAATDGDRATLLTAAQVAQRWQVPVRTTYACAKRNAISPYRAGRLLRFDPVEVEEHFRRHAAANEVAADPKRPGESAFALLSA